MSAFEPLTFWETVRLHLQQPEYLHTLLNPLLVYGLAFGVVALTISLVIRSNHAQRVALALIFISTLAAWPVSKFGEEAYNNVLFLTDDDGRAWLDAHRDLARSVLPVFYTVAALATLAAFLPVAWPRTRRPLTLLTLIGAVIALGCGGWVGYLGGKIRHKEFRYGPPPPSSWTKPPAALK